jgi:hypothetical protein
MRRITRIPRRKKRKKPTWRNTLGYSTTSAYSPTSSPARPGCPSFSHPTTSDEPKTFRSGSINDSILGLAIRKASAQMRLLLGNDGLRTFPGESLLRSSCSSLPELCLIRRKLQVPPEAQERERADEAFMGFNSMILCFFVLPPRVMTSRLTTNCLVRFRSMLP